MGSERPRQGVPARETIILHEGIGTHQRPANGERRGRPATTGRPRIDGCFASGSMIRRDRRGRRTGRRHRLRREGRYFDYRSIEGVHPLAQLFGVTRRDGLPCQIRAVPAPERFATASWPPWWRRSARTRWPPRNSAEDQGRLETADNTAKHAIRPLELDGLQAAIDHQGCQLESQQYAQEHCAVTQGVSDHALRTLEHQLLQNVRRPAMEKTAAANAAIRPTMRTICLRRPVHAPRPAPRTSRTRRVVSSQYMILPPETDARLGWASRPPHPYHCYSRNRPANFKTHAPEAAAPHTLTRPRFEATPCAGRNAAIQLRGRSTPTPERIDRSSGRAHGISPTSRAAKRLHIPNRIHLGRREMRTYP